MDFANYPVEGSFSKQELQKVNKSEDALWIIEKVIRKRKKGKWEEYLVKYDGWPSKFNSWVKKSEVVNIAR